MSDVETRSLPLLPLPNGVILPSMVIPISLESAEAIAAADAAALNGGELILVPRLDLEGGGHVFANVGTVAHLEEAGRLPYGKRAVIVRGLSRGKVGPVVEPAGGFEGLPPGDGGAALWVAVEPVPDDLTPTERALELANEYRLVIEAILEHRRAGPLAEALRGITDPAAMADTAGYSPDLNLKQKVEVLETTDVEARLEKVLGWARATLGELEMKAKIRTDVNEGMEKRQREFMLRQQMEAIRKELGEDGEDVTGDYRAKLSALLRPEIPAAVVEFVEREIDRLERTSEQSPEHGWIRTWLDRIFDLPWTERSDDNLDLAGAREVLDSDHTGLNDVKDRLIEHLAVRKLRKERGLDEPGSGGAEGESISAVRRGSGAILALVGPPGVGKTSLGESVARSLGRKFVRIALGGVRDESEIRGHRRTYVGAQPGRIVRALTEAGTMNPVLLLDEVDKLGADWRGDPTSALLEVLDPAQNHTFRDHYLEVDLDLSEVMFIATANLLETIPGPLLDRMEIIRLDGYTEAEKVAIARDHLLPRQRKQQGLTDDEITVSEAALSAIVTGYTREAGVRGLERELGRLTRKAATRIASGLPAPDSGPAADNGEPDHDGGGADTGSAAGHDGTGSSLVVDANTLVGYLGRPKFYDEAADRTSVPGVATGLAVTGAGGDVLFVEAGIMDGDPGLTVTGQLGDVMKESSQIALSWVRSHAAELGLPDGVFDRSRLHVHFPAGAVPKDGPSAGVTMTTALVSLLTGRPVRSEVGMTGEVTLSGRVLPIGGVKQKVLAAHRAGLTEVILPFRNGPDLDDVPEAVREVMTFHLAKDVSEVLAIALGEAAPAVQAA